MCERERESKFFFEKNAEIAMLCICVSCFLFKPRLDGGFLEDHRNKCQAIKDVEAEK